MSSYDMQDQWIAFETNDNNFSKLGHENLKN